MAGNPLQMPFHVTGVGWLDPGGVRYAGDPFVPSSCHSGNAPISPQRQQWAKMLPKYLKLLSGTVGTRFA